MIARTPGYLILAELLRLDLSNESGEVEIQVTGPNGYLQNLRVKIKKDTSTGNLIVYISNVDSDLQAGEYTWEVVRVKAPNANIFEILSGELGTFVVDQGKLESCTFKGVDVSFVNSRSKSAGMLWHYPAFRHTKPRPGTSRKTNMKIKVATNTTAAPEATFR